MADHVHETAPTQFVEAGGIKLAYRRFGARGATPLLLLNYLAAHMDDWDPKVTNGFAAEHDVIIFDYPGVAKSSGETPQTVAALTKHCADFCRALGVAQFDVVGFSLGGMIAQQLAAENPGLVRRIVLLGTGPRGGEGMVFNDLSPDELTNSAGLIMAAFFTQSAASQAAGRAYLDRLTRRSADRDASVSVKAAVAQITAIREWGAVPASNRFAMLSNIPHPTLVVHGNKDVVVMPINGFLLAQNLPNAQLIMYPDASHAAQSQHGDSFLKHAKLFLE